VGNVSGILCANYSFSVVISMLKCWIWEIFAGTGLGTKLGSPQVGSRAKHY